MFVARFPKTVVLLEYAYKAAKVASEEVVEEKAEKAVEPIALDAPVYPGRHVPRKHPMHGWLKSYKGRPVKQDPNFQAETVSSVIYMHGCNDVGDLPEGFVHLTTEAGCLVTDIVSIYKKGEVAKG
ncbi:hypothetical protein LTR62_003445 [Meristemomyces frigidus]|uniref:Uncharacterized protein n=1 Tax=Meristemomyces frigidus TaxID=1508187 RepID=A0AAN7TEW8_9PEZI|nr:hypothetical protein LTR62_003445 [Meristemomyces frigidus]